MFKKIILGMGVVSVLATTGFAEGIKEVCKYHEEINKKLFDEKVFDVKNSWCSGGEYLNASKMGSMEGFNKKMESKFGVMSTDFLKDGGFGYSKSLNWGNVFYNLNDFICYMKSNNKDGVEEIRKFIISNFKDGSWVSNENYVDNTDNLIQMILNNDEFLYLKAYKGKVESNGGSNLSVYFADEKILDNKKVYSLFMKYIINKDYKRAEAYIKEVNETSGTNKAFKIIKEACQKQK